MKDATAEMMQYLATNATDSERNWVNKEYYQWVYNKLNDENFDINKLFDGAQDNNDTYEAWPNNQTLKTPSKTNIYKVWQSTFDYAVTTTLPGQYSNFQLADLNTISKVPWDGFTPSEESGNTEPTTETIPSTPVVTNSTQFRLINPRTETNPYFKANTDDI